MWLLTWNCRFLVTNVCMFSQIDSQYLYLGYFYKFCNTAQIIVLHQYISQQITIVVFWGTGQIAVSDTWLLVIGVISPHAHRPTMTTKRSISTLKFWRFVVFSKSFKTLQAEMHVFKLFDYTMCNVVFYDTSSLLFSRCHYHLQEALLHNSFINCFYYNVQQAFHFTKSLGTKLFLFLCYQSTQVERDLIRQWRMLYCNYWLTGDFLLFYVKALPQSVSHSEILHLF